MASPGKYYRKGLSLMRLADIFPSDVAGLAMRADRAIGPVLLRDPSLCGVVLAELIRNLKKGQSLAVCLACNTEDPLDSFAAHLVRLRTTHKQGSTRAACGAASIPLLWWRRSG